MDIANNLSNSLSRLFGTAVECSVRYDGGTVYEFTSPAFIRGRDVSLLITRPFKRKYIADVVFGAYGIKLIDVWRSMDDATLEKALHYLWLFGDRLNIKLSLNRARVTNQEIAILEMRKIRTPDDFSLRATCRFDENNSAETLYQLVQCVFGFLLMLSGVIPEEGTMGTSVSEHEGANKRTEITRYERSPKNRAICIAAHGSRCAICGIDFGKMYGGFATGYIEVHHRVPVSKLGESLAVDPVKDLIPLCPNCHAVVHMSDPPYSPEKIKSMLLERDDLNK